MIDEYYFRFYKWTHLELLSILLSYMTRFAFFLRFLIKRLTIKHEAVDMDERTALSILQKTSPDPELIPDYSMECAVAGMNLSIIVPVYNHIDVIERCINSLIEQKTRFSYELILVDDGSSDGAQVLIDQYSVYSNVRIFHQENGGIAAARNTGISHARGRYLMFVDCDDYVHVDIVEKMMERAIAEDADIVMCAHSLVKVKNGVEVSRLSNIYPQINMFGVSNESVILNYPGLPWGKVYKRELFEKVRFFPGYWYEDNIIHGLIFMQCNRFIYLPEVLYEYQWHESNFSHIQGGKNQKKGIDSFWLLKAILERYTLLGLDRGSRYYTMLLRHLSAYYYTTVSSLSNEIVQAMFVVACGLLMKYRPVEKVTIPYMLRLTEKAMINHDFSLWKLCSVNQ